MLFTRLPEKKYLLGIDIGETFCQISYLNTRRLTAGMDPHTFSYVTGREEFNIPAVAFQDPESGRWTFGNEALDLSAQCGKDPVSHLLTCAGQETEESGEGSYTQILIAFLKYCLSLLSVEVTSEEIEALTFTTADMSRKNAEILRKAAEMLFPGFDKVAYEEHIKSFYHYVLMQDEEQRRQSVLLVDGWSDTELVLYTLSFNKKTRPIVCFPQEHRLRIPAEGQDPVRRGQGTDEGKGVFSSISHRRSSGRRLDEGFPESDLQRQAGFSGRYALQQRRRGQHNGGLRSCL